MQNNGHCGVERTNQCQKVNGWYEVSEGGMNGMNRKIIMDEGMNQQSSINKYIKEVNGNEQV